MTEQPAERFDDLAMHDLTFADDTRRVYVAGRIFMTDDEIDAVKDRLDRDDLSVMGLRFDGDPYCRAERFDTCTRCLRDRFTPTVLPDGTAGELGWIGVPHRIRTTSLRDAHGEPTAQGRDSVIDFLTDRLDT